ncbi:MAG TPA: hydantoinase/oxoprolinase family protein, partial [Alphaproteobacteria bacterium]|nr:hydantoinase/oxoprolinase family protein [Alphaproteobacteria bacterium]
VCFLWSFFNAEHEQAVRQVIERVAPGAYVSLSSDIAPVPGEYERTSTTVINAYAGSIAALYLNNLQELLIGEGYTGPLLVMQGYGGLLPAEEAAGRAVGMIECGPAAGVIGSRYLGQLMGDGDVIAADMGGTTFKVGVIEGGEFDYAREPMVDRFHYVAPKIEMVSIGAGGGSIVSLDARTNVPSVGPRSAGARPGPICYGQGGEEPTLTDVMILVGYMDPENFLGGSMRLDLERTRAIFKQKVADPLGLGVEEAAIGIFRIAAAQITDLIHEITVERGLDPRDFVLHAFGGSCPTVCGIFGAELSVKHIVIPYTAAVNCAFGLVSADIVHEYSVTKTLPVPSDAEEVNAIYAPMLAQATAQLGEEGFAESGTAFEWSIDLRYGRQVHEVTTPVRGVTPVDEASLAALTDDFEALYERKYGKGSAYRAAGMEMTMFRLTARGLMTRPEIEKLTLGGKDAGAARTGRRPIFVDAAGTMVESDIYDLELLAPGNEITGPAVIHTPITTIVLQDQQTGLLDEYRNMVIQFN